MEKLALFDIDYTITKKETLMEFYKYIVSRDIKNIKFLPRALYSGAMYGIGIYDEKRVKESFLKFIENIEEKELAILTKEFYHDRLSKILYKDAVDMIKKLKNETDAEVITINKLDNISDEDRDKLNKNDIKCSYLDYTSLMGLYIERWTMYSKKHIMIKKIAIFRQNVE